MHRGHYTHPVLGKPAPTESVHAAVLFADLENSVMLSATLSPEDYDELVNNFQAVMQQLVADLRAQGYPIGESSVAGDQLSIFLYDPAETERNEQLDSARLTEQERRGLVQECREKNENLLFAAVKAAILLKNSWLVQDFNLRRVHAQREPLGLALGIHFGRVYLRERPDGRRRIEGFAVNLAKRIEGFSRQGQYSRIMLSQEAYERLRAMVIRHTQLRQRLFFHRHDVSLELLKGITQSQAVYELKFFSLIGITLDPEVIRQHEAMFYLKRSIWSYYQLFEHYAYELKDWSKVYAALLHVMIAHPTDEKVLLDMSRYYLHQGDVALARELAEQSLAQNGDFDLAYEHLGQIAAADGRVEEELLCYRKAVSLAPGSPVNHINLGIKLCELEDLRTAEQHLLLALETYPGFAAQPRWRASLETLQDMGRLPVPVLERLQALDQAVAAAATIPA